MANQDSEDEIRSRFMFELAIWIWQDELNPRAGCAFGNVLKLSWKSHSKPFASPPCLKDDLFITFLFSWRQFHLSFEFIPGKRFVFFLYHAKTEFYFCVWLVLLWSNIWLNFHIQNVTDKITFANIMRRKYIIVGILDCSSLRLFESQVYWHY